MAPAVRRHRGDPAAGRRGGDDRQDQHGRVRHGVLHRELGVRHHPQPARHHPGPGRVVRRIGGGGGRRVRPDGLGLRHRRLHPPAGRPVRGGGDETHLRHGVSLRPGGLRQLAGPDRPVRPLGGRRRPAVRRDRGPRPGRLDITEPPHAAGPVGPRRGDRGADRRRAVRVPRRRPSGGDGPDPPGGRGLHGRRGPGRGGLGAGGPAWPVRLLPDRPGRGLLQPGPLRRGPVRPAGGRRGHRGHEHRHPLGRLRRRGQAPDHAWDLRPLRRVHGRLLQPGLAGPDHDHRGLRHRLPAVRRPAGPHHPDHRLHHRREGRRPDEHVPLGRLHHPHQPGRPPGHQRAVRHRRGWLPIGVQLLAPALGESVLFRAAAVLEAAAPAPPPTGRWS